MDMSQLLSPIPFTIANGASLSNGKNITGLVPYIIMMPAAWTDACLTFQGSRDDSTYYDLYDEEGTEITIPAAATRRIIIPSAIFTNHKFLKIRSGIASVPVLQGAERIIYMEVWD
jgi:hypothetical protein